MIQQMKIALKLFLVFTIITGFFYPGIVWLIAQTAFPWQANGSLIKKGDKIIGSALIGQHFTDHKYFWGRPSGTDKFPYNPLASQSFNLGPSTARLSELVNERIITFHKLDESNNKRALPIDLITGSASGLDPDISLMAAFYQIPRVAKVRQMPETDVYILVEKLIQEPVFGLLGEPRVNVLRLNIALDKHNSEIRKNIY